MHGICQMIQGLDVGVVREFDLMTELQALKSTYAQIGSMQISLDLHPAAIEVLTKEEEREILSIAREALSNSVRHARATQAAISIRKRGDRIRLRISDDGRGFDRGNGRRGWLWPCNHGSPRKKDRRHLAHSIQERPRHRDHHGILVGTHSVSCMRRPTRILILNDHELVRKGLRTFLESEPDLLVVGEAGTLAEALPLVARLHPPLILLDMKLPDASGRESCRQLLAAAPNLRILVLTDDAKAPIVADTIKSGAHGYILKDVRLNDLAQAIHTVAEGRGYLDPRITQYALHWIRSGVSRASPLQGLKVLSPQERLIMPLLAQGKTNKEIAAQMKLSDKTIKNYLVNIYTKLKVSRRTEAVAWFIREYRSDESADPISPHD